MYLSKEILKVAKMVWSNIPSLLQVIKEVSSILDPFLNSICNTNNEKKMHFLF